MQSTQPLRSKLPRCAPLGSRQSAPLRARQLHFELSIPAAELRTCSGCAKVLFEPRHAQPHACPRAAGPRATLQQQPDKKRRPRTQPEPARSKPDGINAAKRQPPPRTAEDTRPVPTTLEHAQPPATLLDPTRTSPTSAQQFRRVTNITDQFRTVPTTPEQFRTVPSITEQFQTNPSFPEQFRKVPSAPEQFWTVPSRAEQFRIMEPASSSRGRGCREAASAARVSNAIHRLAGELRNPYAQAPCRPINAQPAKQHRATAEVEADRGGFAADVLFAAGSTFRAGRPRDGPAAAVTRNMFDEEFARALQRRQELARDTVNLEVAERAKRAKKACKKAAGGRVTLKETPSQAGRHRSKPKLRPRAPSPMPGVGTPNGAGPSRRLLRLDEAGEGR